MSVSRRAHPTTSSVTDLLDAIKYCPPSTSTGIAPPNYLRKYPRNSDSTTESRPSTAPPYPSKTLRERVAQISPEKPIKLADAYKHGKFVSYSFERKKERHTGILKGYGEVFTVFTKRAMKLTNLIPEGPSEPSTARDQMLALLCGTLPTLGCGPIHMLSGIALMEIFDELRSQETTAIAAIVGRRICVWDAEDIQSCPSQPESANVIRDPPVAVVSCASCTASADMESSLLLHGYGDYVSVVLEMDVRVWQRDCLYGLSFVYSHRISNGSASCAHGYQNRLGVGTNTGWVTVLDLSSSSKMVSERVISDSKISQICLTPSCVLILDIRNVTHTLSAWSLGLEHQLVAFGLETSFTTLLTSVSGNTVVSSCFPYSATIWKLSETCHFQEIELRPSQGQGHAIRSIHCCRGVISVAVGDTIQVYEAKTGRVLSCCVGHKDTVLEARVVDGSTIISSSADGTIRVWNGSTGRQKRRTIVVAEPIVRLAAWCIPNKPRSCCAKLWQQAASVV